MRKRADISLAVWGLLSVMAGGLMAEGGVMEVLFYWPRGQASNVIVGALGAAASGLLLASGVAFWTRRPFGRKVAVAGALGMVPVHFVGWIVGFVGYPGLLLGVVYPMALLLVLRAKPGLGAPTPTPGKPVRPEPPSSSDHPKRRTLFAHRLEDAEEARRFA